MNDPNAPTRFDADEDELIIQDSAGSALNANDLARSVIAGKAPQRLDGTTAQLMIDSLYSANSVTRKLHARAITKLWPSVDGAVAESMGMAALEYTQIHPVEFFSLFPDELDPQALHTWSDMIAQELLIDYEHTSLEAAEKFSNDLKMRCSDQGSPKDVEIKRLHQQLISRLMELTKT